ncbi:MAG TPA: hypothetical protein EYO73_06460 [Sulfurimonas sp.]|nr:hypothetical protein [Sulfurimonas sp.]
MNKSKKWIVNWSLLLVLIPFIGFVNYYVDPFWTYSHSNTLNQLQKPFNERQQKTNNIYFNGFEKYDGILVGSSRSTYVNQDHFTDMNIYNYGFNGGSPYEQLGFIEFAKEMNKKDLKYLIMGMDFTATIKPPFAKLQGASTFVKNSKGLAYKYKTLISATTLIQSIKNIVSSLKGSSRVYYTRENHKYRRAISDEKRFKKYLVNIKGNAVHFTDERYKYYDGYILALQKIKDANPNTKIIVYTSPVHANFLLAMLKAGDSRVDDYDRWLRELISVYGEVWHFMTINSVTTKLKNYPDAEHFYENVGKFVANKITHKHLEGTPEDFGVLLNKENIDDYIKKFRMELNNHHFDINNHTFDSKDISDI